MRIAIDAAVACSSCVAAERSRHASCQGSARNRRVDPRSSPSVIRRPQVRCSTPPRCACRDGPQWTQHNIIRVQIHEAVRQRRVEPPESRACSRCTPSSPPAPHRARPSPAVTWSPRAAPATRRVRVRPARPRAFPAVPPDRFYFQSSSALRSHGRCDLPATCSPCSTRASRCRKWRADARRPQGPADRASSLRSRPSRTASRSASFAFDKPRRNATGLLTSMPPPCPRPVVDKDCSTRGKES